MTKQLLKLFIMCACILTSQHLSSTGGKVHSGGADSGSSESELDLGGGYHKEPIDRPHNISDAVLASAFSTNDTGSQIIIVHPCAPGTKTPDLTRPIRSYSVHSVAYKGPGSYHEVAERNKQLLLFGYIVAETVLLTAAAPLLLPEEGALALGGEVALGAAAAEVFAPGEEEGLAAANHVPKKHVDKAIGQQSPTEYLLINNHKGSTIEVTKTNKTGAVEAVDYIEPSSGTYQLPYNDDTEYTFKKFTGTQEELAAKKANSLQQVVNGSILFSNQSGSTVVIYRINQDGSQTHVHSIHASKQFYQLQCAPNTYYLLKMYVPKLKRGVIQLKSSHGKVETKKELRTLHRSNKLTSGYDSLAATRRDFKRAGRALKKAFHVH